MQWPFVQSVLWGALLAGCAGQSSIKPAEVLDERTGVTVGALQTPIELIEETRNAAAGPNARTSFGYLGPVEWDKSGDISYGLWIHVAPGNDRQIGDIHSQGGVTLMLDDGPVALTPIDAPAVGSGPYRPVASWGQTSYFALDVALLKRMSASATLALEFRGNGNGNDQSPVQFTPTHGTRDTLLKFMQARGITGD
jgi:hypothetical protein